MKRKLFYLLLFLAALLVGCTETNEPTPPKAIPPGLQTDIDWPSLAQSPWPMAQHDPQSTGRSPLIGPASGSIIWQNDLYNSILSGISQEQDSSILLTTGLFYNAGIIKLNSNGGLIWHQLLRTDKNFTTPLITSEGNYICYDSYSKILSISPEDSILWTFEASAGITQETVNIGLDGAIYFLDVSKNLYSISSNGNLLWKLHDARFTDFMVVVHSAFSPDGKTLYVPGRGTSILALDVKTASVKWTYGESNMAASPMVDSYGNIYAFSKEGMVSINPDGKLNWKYPSNYGFSSNPDVNPCIDYEGNVYFSTDTLYAVDYQGKLLWKKYLNGWSGPSLICDKNGTVYVGINTFSSSINIAAYNHSGNLVWESEDIDAVYCANPAIGYNGVLYYPFYYNSIIAIK